MTPALTFGKSDEGAEPHNTRVYVEVGGDTPESTWINVAFQAIEYNGQKWKDVELLFEKAGWHAFKAFVESYLADHEKRQADASNP